MLNIFLQGFFLQASLILALGAQNIFVLNAGLRKEKPSLVAFVSTVCDALLIFIGVLGVATFFVQIPALKMALGVVGVAFLFYYGFLKLKEAKTTPPSDLPLQKTLSVQQTILTTVGFSLLNPHVYLDTVVLIGGYSSKFNFLIERFYFGLGASFFSGLWFFGLVLTASAASRFLNSPKSMRWVSLVSGLILISLAFKLSMDVYEWSR